MPSFRKAFPSKWLASSDLDDPIVVTIDHTTTENVGGENGGGDLKLIAHFRERVKPLVLNLTRATAIAEIAGTEDTDRWAGVTIQITRGSTRYMGRVVSCLDVTSAPARTARAPRPQAPDTAAPPADAVEMDDGETEITF